MKVVPPQLVDLPICKKGSEDINSTEILVYQEFCQSSAKISVADMS